MKSFKNSKVILALILGFLLGAASIGNLASVSGAATANYSPDKVFVDGTVRSIEGYKINGNNYYKLRDIARVVDFGVWFDDAQNRVNIETDKSYDENYTGYSIPTPTPTPTPTPSPSSTVKPTPQPAQSTGTTVYITKTGEKYHVDSCSYLRQSKISISLSEAKRLGYTPCSRCNPPR
jgi:hypothetical protein